MLLVALGCTQKPSEKSVDSTHPSGFSLRRPASADVQVEPERMIIRPAGWRTLRSPYELVVQRTDALPEAGYSREKKGDRTVYHREQTHTAGSGGPLHELEGVVESGGVIFRVRLTEQSEANTPPHAWAYWEALQSVQLAK